jgi:hypothetical protein
MIFWTVSLEVVTVKGVPSRICSSYVGYADDEDARGMTEEGLSRFLLRAASGDTVSRANIKVQAPQPRVTLRSNSTPRR